MAEIKHNHLILSQNHLEILALQTIVALVKDTIFVS